MQKLGSHKNAAIDENMLRHMILNSLRSYQVKFKENYGELVICSDDRNYWRQTIFPFYKASRKRNRNKSEIDWHSIFNFLDRIKDELKKFFPYRVIQIETAEADDIIGALVHKFGSIVGGKPILILSGDKDYIQLHVYNNVSQYDPIRKRWIQCDDPENYLEEHIIKGDSGDGVPNVLSPDDSFMSGKRQKSITKKRLSEWKSLNSITKESNRNYKRNKSLIDLNEIPNQIKSEVIKIYESELINKDRSQLLNYFMENKMKHLMEAINDF